MESTPAEYDQYPNYAGAGAGLAAASNHSTIPYNTPSHPSQMQNQVYADYPVNPINTGPTYPPAQHGLGQEYYDAGLGAVAGGVMGAGGHQVHSNPEVAALGLRDGMMVRVKVGFVRSLEDELGQSPRRFHPPSISPPLSRKL
jgi:hypothetical protein